MESSSSATPTFQKSDSGLNVALHPLVLLTISDYITRHILRQQTGPIIGALLGQQNDRETTVEHAFECRTKEGLLDMEWFDRRLLQMKDVHKAPALDLVGWYATMSTTGPSEFHLPVQQQLSSLYPECTMLLGFHPNAMSEASVGGKLPITIFESIYEPTRASGNDDMVVDQPEINFTFKELPYTVETGEAEMISVDFVAKGGGNATAITESKAAPAEAPSTKSSQSQPTDKKGKKRTPVENDNAKAREALPLDDEHNLNREEEELVASLTAKTNAIKMLHSRIHLISSYLTSLPPSYLNGSVTDISAEKETHPQVDTNILRSISALLNRLALLVPANSSAFSEELLAEQNDVNLVNVLSTLSESLKNSRDLGKKFAAGSLGIARKRDGGGNGISGLTGMGGYDNIQDGTGSGSGGKSGGMMSVGDLVHLRSALGS